MKLGKTKLITRHARREAKIYPVIEGDFRHSYFFFVFHRVYCPRESSGHPHADTRDILAGGFNEEFIVKSCVTRKTRTLMPPAISEIRWFKNYLSFVNLSNGHLVSFSPDLRSNIVIKKPR